MASSLSEGIRAIGHSERSELGHTVFGRICRILGWGRMGCIHGEEATMICRSNRICFIITSGLWINVRPKLMYPPGTQSTVVYSLQLAYGSISIWTFPLRKEVEDARCGSVR